jgi:hypothetical protein
VSYPDARLREEKATDPRQKVVEHPTRKRTHELSAPFPTKHSSSPEKLANARVANAQKDEVEDEVMLEIG